MQQEGIRLDNMFVKTLFNNNSDDVCNTMDELKQNSMYLTDNIIQRVEKV